MKNSTLSHIFRLATLVVLLALPGLSADTLVSYTFGTNSSSVALNPTGGVHTGITASSIWSTSGFINLERSGADIAPSGPSALGLSRNVTGSTTLAHSETEAVSSNRWIAFQFAPVAGQTVTLESVSFWANIGSVTSSANSVAVQVRIGDSTNAYTTLGTTTITHVGAAGNGGSYSVALSGLSGITETLAIRLLFFNTDGSTTTWSDYTRIDDLTAHGTVASVIPEPATMGLVLAFISLIAVGLIRSCVRR